MKPGSSWARIGVLPISRTIWDAFSTVSGDVDVPRTISTSFVSWAGLKKCIPIVLSFLEFLCGVFFVEYFGCLPAHDSEPYDCVFRSLSTLGLALAPSIL